MSYRTKVKSDANGTLIDLPLDAETLGGENLATVKRYTPHYPTAISGTEAVETSPYYCARWDATDSSITTLYDGLTIIIRVPVAGSSNYGVGLSVNGGDYHPVVYNVSTSIGSRYGVNSTIVAVYNSTQHSPLYMNSASTTSITGVWQVYDYDSDSDTYYRLRNNSADYFNKSGQATNRRTLLFEVDGGLSATNKTIATGTTKVPLAFKYIPYGQIRYYLTSGEIANNAQFTSTGLYEQYPLDIRYSFNTGSTLISGSPVYIRMVVNSDGTLSQDATTAGANPIVQELPSTADNKVYVYLGRAGSTTVLELEVWHPIYEYKDGAIRLWTNAVESGSIKKDGGNAIQTIALTSGTGTTALGLKSASNPSYISFSNSSSWLASFGITSDKKPTIYDGTSHFIAYTSDIEAYHDSSKQDSLTTTSVTDGTIDKVIGFDSNGNLVKDTASSGGSGTVTSVSTGTGLAISGTATINPTINIASGYKLPTTSEWSSKQNALTTTSVNDGTINKIIGFDSNGNIVKATQSSGGSIITFVDWS